MKNKMMAAALVLSVVAWSARQGRAQSGGVIELFHGGVIAADLRIGNSGLNAVSGTFEGIGGGFSQLTPGGESVRWNPAGLAYLRRSLIYSEWLPPVSVDLNPLLDIEDSANREMRSAVFEHSPGPDSLDLQDFSIGPKIALDGGQGNYAGIIKTKHFVLGGAVHNANRLLANITISGTKFRAATESENRGTTIRLLGVLTGTLSTEFNMTGLSLALGKRLGQKFGAGVGFDNYSATINAAAFVQPEAQVSSGAQEFFFNSGAAAHYDSLQARAAGAFWGDAARWRFGAGYHAGRTFAVDLALFTPLTVQFRGDLTYSYDQVLAFNLDAEGDEPFFDAGQLLQDDFTGTHPRRTLVHAVQLRMPGELALALAGRWRKLSGSVSYIRYFRDLSLAFSYESGGDETAPHSTGSWRLGIRPSYALFANMGLRWLQLKVGVTRLQWVRRHSKRTFAALAPVSAPLLGLSGGFTLPYLKRLRLDYALSVGLTSFFRIGTSYLL